MAINTYFKNIADAIREKTGGSTLITPGQMPGEIRNISGGIEEITPLHTNLKGLLTGGNRWEPTSTNPTFYSNVYYIDDTDDYFFVVDNNPSRISVAQFYNDPATVTSGSIGGTNLNSNGIIYPNSPAPNYILSTNMKRRDSTNYILVFTICNTQPTIKAFKTKDLF